MSQKKLNIHDWSLLVLGLAGLVLLIIGTLYDTASKCDSVVWGIKTNDSTLLGAILAIVGIGYKSIVKFLQTKFNKEK